MLVLAVKYPFRGIGEIPRDMMRSNALAHITMRVLHLGVSITDALLLKIWGMDW